MGEMSLYIAFLSLSPFSPNVALLLSLEGKERGGRLRSIRTEKRRGESWLVGSSPEEGMEDPCFPLPESTFFLLLLLVLFLLLFP